MESQLHDKVMIYNDKLNNHQIKSIWLLTYAFGLELFT